MHADWMHHTRRSSGPIPFLRRLGLAFAALLFVPLVASAHDRLLPEEAQQLILATHQAALKRDLPTLRRLMTADFISSFGPDAGPDATIEGWRKSPADLDVLAWLTAQACALDESPNAVQCPPDAGVDFRAGFVRTPNGWRLAYFLAGD